MLQIHNCIRKPKLIIELCPGFKYRRMCLEIKENRKIKYINHLSELE